jgi:hypothetical protein
MSVKSLVIIVAFAIIGIFVYLWFDSGIRIREREERLKRQSELRGYKFARPPSESR